MWFSKNYCRIGEIAAVILFCLFESAFAVTRIGVAGDIWRIAEPDPVEEIRKIAMEKQETIQAVLESEKELENFKPVQEVKALPAADKPESYIVDTIYTLAHDITDAEGNILYPAGFTYNVLDFAPFPLTRRYVIFNGADEKEAALVADRYGDDPMTRFFVTGDINGWIKIVRSKGGLNAVKLLTPETARLFHLKATISVVYQEGDHLRVDVIPALQNEETKSKNP